jgi:hypothetical protein
MTAPLDLPDLVSMLVVVWICALIVPVCEAALARYRGRVVTRPIAGHDRREACR